MLETFSRKHKQAERKETNTKKQLNKSVQADLIILFILFYILHYLRYLEEDRLVHVFSRPADCGQLSCSLLIQLILKKNKQTKVRFLLSQGYKKSVQNPLKIQSSLHRFLIITLTQSFNLRHHHSPHLLYKEAVINSFTLNLTNS